MVGSPSEVEEGQLRELGIEIAKPRETPPRRGETTRKGVKE